jgi:alkanesulfonate monooxygenase SsuD/methylene tetrahydromethanopterin reductase-like flavin-dependent oxidoreductase (luciferase family)
MSTEGEPALRFAVGVPNVGPFGEAGVILELAVLAEESGWDGVFVWDHLIYREADWPVADPWVALSAACNATHRVRLGVLVAGLARRRPWQVAKTVSTLDQLSGGRLVLGAGLGSIPEEYERFGEPAEAKVRAEKLDEALTVISGLQSGEDFSFDGSHHRVSGVRMLPPPQQRPRVPIWIGGRWPNRAPFRRAARYDGVVPTHVDFEKGETMPPAVVHEVVSYVEDHRVDRRPFDVALEGRTSGNDRGDRRLVKQYGDAGVNWWIEALGWWRGTVADAKQRVRIGPPA